MVLIDIPRNTSKAVTNISLRGDAMAKVKLTAGRIAGFQCDEGKAQSFLWCTEAAALQLKVFLEPVTVSAVWLEYMCQSWVSCDLARSAVPCQSVRMDRNACRYRCPNSRPCTARCARAAYLRRPLDLLRMWHVKIEAWILEQAGIKYVPVQAGLQLVRK